MIGPSRAVAALILALGVAVVPASAEDQDPGAWEYAMERMLLRDRVRLIIDDETAMEAHMRFVGDRREARAEGEFRGHALNLRCKRNPLVDALDCWVRVDGELRSNHVVVQ